MTNIGRITYYIGRMTRMSHKNTIYTSVNHFYVIYFIFVNKY